VDVAGAERVLAFPKRVPGPLAVPKSSTSGVALRQFVHPLGPLCQQARARIPPRPLDTGAAAIPSEPQIA